VERPGGVEKRSDQYTEPDEQPDFRHDFAEALGDRLYRAGEADAGSQAEVERGEEQRDDRVDFKQDDQTDGQNDRDGGMESNHGGLLRSVL
jgi:hypothetical protein